MLKSFSHVAVMSLLALGFALSPFGRQAEAANGPMCAARQELLQAFSEGYAEAPTAIGLASSGGVLELLTSENGSWTVFMTLPSGMSCLIATGQSWTMKRPQPQESTS
ncbi:MAG: hypothetical protein HYR63_11555 [Proteobacteria bacterium]|nr:hypothetical protein [Pseudomonadota bacterium]MBI3496353.1 hypothetical protein [Pseudomonadota bacterium]